MGSTNSNFGKCSQNFFCFLETNFWEEKSSYPVNTSHYLYPNNFNLSIDIFSYIYIYIYITTYLVYALYIQQFYYSLIWWNPQTTNVNALIVMNLEKIIIKFKSFKILFEHSKIWPLIKILCHLIKCFFFSLPLYSPYSEVKSYLAEEITTDSNFFIHSKPCGVLAARCSYQLLANK